MIDRPLILGFVLSLCFAFAAPARSEQQSAPASSWERYKIITENNVFLRNRSRPVQRTVESETPVRRPRTSLVLTGIVGQGEKYVAFFEDTRTGMTSVVGTDASLVEGRITEIAVDHILLERGDQIIKVGIGGTLDSPASTQAAATASTPSEGTAAAESPEASQGPAASPAASSNGTLGANERAILERLRQRRQRELTRP